MLYPFCLPVFYTRPLYKWSVVALMSKAKDYFSIRWKGGSLLIVCSIAGVGGYCCHCFGTDNVSLARSHLTICINSYVPKKMPSTV